jgi:hypothetical protein
MLRNVGTLYGRWSPRQMSAAPAQDPLLCKLPAVLTFLPTACTATVSSNDTLFTDTCKDTTVSVSVSTAACQQSALS